jgi:hypothetical protein
MTDLSFDLIQLLKLQTSSFELGYDITVIINENVMVKSTKETIKTIDVYDLLKKIDSYKM